MNFTAKEKMRAAVAWSFWPRWMAIWTEAPVAIILAMASTIRMTGMVMLMAASASSPMKRPTNMPSTTA